MSQYERTGWRDAGMSARHRKWGPKLCLVDDDCVWVECTDTGEPRGLFEWINEHGDSVDENTFKIVVLVRLADRAQLPAFVTRYADDYSWYEVTGFNDLAKKFVESSRRFTESEYVCLLYQLRGFVITDEVRSAIDNKLRRACA